jgi:hypothetical protein
MSNFIFGVSADIDLAEVVGVELTEEQIQEIAGDTGYFEKLVEKANEKDNDEDRRVQGGIPF